MSKEINVRLGWIRECTFTPSSAPVDLDWESLPCQISCVQYSIALSIIFGINGSVYLAFALLSILGLRAPLKFLPVLLLQLSYKSIWIIGVILPLLVGGRFPAYGILLVAIYATYIIGDLIAIPFSYLFANQAVEYR
jgi:hypothetical protein